MGKYKLKTVIIQVDDVLPYSFNKIPNILHWRINITATDYWVVCGSSPEDALRRFESFSNYKVENAILYT